MWEVVEEVWEVQWEREVGRCDRNRLEDNEGVKDE